MKAVTVWQSWASLIIIGAKPWEFRSRSYFAYVHRGNFESQTTAKQLPLGDDDHSLLRP